MTAEEYIAQYGGSLSASEKRYIMAFGPPAFTPGPSRSPSTPGMRIANAPAELAGEEHDLPAHSGPRGF